MQTVKGQAAGGMLIRSPASVNRRIFGAIVTVGFWSMLAKVLALAKDLIVAPRFGLGDELDAYFVATLLPSFAVTVLAGPLTTALIPIYVLLRERQGAEAAQRLFSNVMILSLLLLLFVSAGLWLAFPFIVQVLGSGFSPDKLMLTERLFLFLLPTITLNGMALVWSAILNARESFFLGALAFVITPLVVIIVLLAGDQSWGIQLLIVGLVLGAALEAVLLGLAVAGHGISLWPRWYGFDASTRQVIFQYWPLVIGSLVLGVTPLIDQAVAATLGSGAISALSYGNKLILVILGVISTAVGTAVLPYFARMVAEEDWTGLGSSLRHYSVLLLCLTVPLSLVMMVLSEPMIRLLFQRGNFTAEQTGIVATVQICYLFQVPFYVLGMLGVRALSALKMSRTILVIAIGSLTVNLVLDLVLAAFLGVAGIALSTSGVYAFSCAAHFLALWRYARKRVTRLETSAAAL